MIVPACQTAVCLLMAIAGTVQIGTAVPAVEDMPLSVTSYWLFDDTGQPVAWGGQADGDPLHYANGQTTSPDDAGRVAACIGEWVKRGYTTAVSFTWQGQPVTVACYDAFGLESYRQPFFHEGYGEWVVPIDLLSPVPFHGLVREWNTAVVEVK